MHDKTAWLSMRLSLFFYTVVLFAACQASKAVPNPAPQMYGTRLEVNVVGVEKANAWEMMPGNLLMPKILPKEGQDLIVVKFSVKDIQTAQEDTNKSFKDFELEDLQGNKYPGELVKTDLREAPFLVPTGTQIKFFRISGLTFDIEPFTMNAGKK